MFGQRISDHVRDTENHLADILEQLDKMKKNKLINKMDPELKKELDVLFKMSYTGYRSNRDKR